MTERTKPFGVGDIVGNMWIEPPELVLVVEVRVAKSFFEYDVIYLDKKQGGHSTWAELSDFDPMFKLFYEAD